MKKLFLLFIVLFIFSCDEKEEEILTDCEINHTFNVDFSNATKYTCAIYVDGKYYASIGSGEKKTGEFFSGKKNFKFVYNNQSISRLLAGRECDVYNLTIYEDSSEPDTPTIPVVPDCEKNNTCDLYVKNNESDDYDIYWGDSFIFRINKKSSKTLTIPAGQQVIKCKQANGYILWPTVYNKTVSGAACTTVNITIP